MSYMNGIASAGSGSPKGSSPQDSVLPVNDDPGAYVAVNVSQEPGRLPPGITQFLQ